jgi:hypothetical protein
MRWSRHAVHIRQLNNTCETESNSDWEQLDLRAPPVQVLSCPKKESQPSFEASLLIYSTDNVQPITTSGIPKSTSDWLVKTMQNTEHNFIIRNSYIHNCSTSPHSCHPHLDICCTVTLVFVVPRQRTVPPSYAASCWLLLWYPPCTELMVTQSARDNSIQNSPRSLWKFLRKFWYLGNHFGNFFKTQGDQKKQTKAVHNPFYVFYCTEIKMLQN